MGDSKTNTGIGRFGSPIDISASVIYPQPSDKFRESTNTIEGKIWYELDVTDADTIVIISDGKQVVVDKKDFLQKVGLEW